jgi:hypothetical protein
MRVLGSIALAGAILFAPAAIAAPVSVIPVAGTQKNTVFLSHGKGFAPIMSVTEAQTGDSVMALRSGVAIIVYPDGCRVKVSATTAVVTVQETSPCKTPVVQETTGKLGVGKYIVGAVILGAAVTAVALVAGGGGGTTQNDHGPGKPASP